MPEQLCQHDQRWVLDRRWFVRVHFPDVVNAWVAQGQSAVETELLADDPIAIRLGERAVQLCYDSFVDAAVVEFMDRSGRGGRIHTVETVELKYDHRPAPLLLGADPEFVVAHADGRIVPADALFGSRYDGIGCDRVALAGGGERGVIGELRPAPAATVPELLDNVSSLLGAARARLPRGASLLAHHAALPLGGHVHVSGGAPLTPKLVRQLDGYVAFVLAHRTPWRAKQPRHGRLGNVRRQPHGGFEYRTLASWLGDEQQIAGALALVWIVAQCSSELPPGPATDPKYVAAYYAGEDVRCGQLASLRRTTKYEEVSKYVEPLLLKST